MSARTQALDDLAACLRGAPPIGADWLAVVALANRTLVTPTLARMLLEHEAVLDRDLPRFLVDVHARNLERNRRLKAQLEEAIGALNGAGIEPVLMKGAASLLQLTGRDLGDRILVDLDLLVDPDQIEAACAVLAGLGYSASKMTGRPDFHVVAEFSRASDVGLIDLHRRAPGPPELADVAGLRGKCERVTLAGGAALVPLPHVQAIFLVLHDQFHDGDYLAGRFDLRHLIDLTRLAQQGMDWAALEAAFPEGAPANALRTQLLSAHELLGLHAPARLLGGARARFQYNRRMAQLAWPSLAPAMVAATLLIDVPDLLRHGVRNRTARQAVFGAAHRRMPVRERLGRVASILTPGRSAKA